jgi:glycerol-3-phosphate acyltransferase PlsY
MASAVTNPRNLMNILPYLAVILSSYFIGAIPFALWITRWKTGIDVRSVGSGHAGATNAMRATGWGTGILVMLLDLAKGYAGLWITLQLTPVPAMLGVSAALIVIGHCWPVFAGFRGGMGMASGGGALLAVWPLGFILGIGLGALLQLLIRHSARGNIATAILLPPIWLLFGANGGMIAVAIGAGLFVALRALSDWNRVYRELWFDRGESEQERD